MKLSLCSEFDNSLMSLYGERGRIPAKYLSDANSRALRVVLIDVIAGDHRSRMNFGMNVRKYLDIALPAPLPKLTAERHITMVAGRNS